MVLELFINSLLSNVATYIDERKVKTAAKAAALSDKYVLMHKVDFVWSDDWADTSELLSGGQSDAHVCNYCKERGHWKAVCPAIREKSKHNGDVHVKSVALAATIRTVSGSSLSCGQVDVKGGSQAEILDYLLFVSDSFHW